MNKCPYCGRLSTARPSFHGTFRTVTCTYEPCGKGFIVPPATDTGDYKILVKALYQDLCIKDLMEQ